MPLISQLLKSPVKKYISLLAFPPEYLPFARISGFLYVPFTIFFKKSDVKFS